MTTITAELTRINEPGNEPGTSFDLIEFFADGQRLTDTVGAIEPISVPSSENEAPYVAAIEQAGWVITGRFQDGYAVEWGRPLDYRAQILAHPGDQELTVVDLRTLSPERLDALAVAAGAAGDTDLLRTLTLMRR
jgi:hypothetical protein